jgi:hypothetical protein
MELLNWHKPITTDKAEQEFLNFLLDDPYISWAQLFNDAQLNRAINGIKQAINPVQDLAYRPPTQEALKEMISRLTKNLPPTLAQIDSDGKPILSKVTISQTLHAGWVYWINREQSPSVKRIEFFQTNRLCDLALLHQRAINDAYDAGVQ